MLQNHQQNLSDKTNIKSHTLSIKNLVNHYFLLHDFFYKITKLKPHSAQFFDLQYDINTGMNNAARTGAKLGQFGSLGLLCIYCLKSSYIRRKFIFGFLYIYWSTHLVTLGSYLGVLFRMPSLFNKSNKYFTSKDGSELNYFCKLNELMLSNNDYEDPRQLLNQIFPIKLKQASFVENSYFIKNKQKYIDNLKLQQYTNQKEKLPILNCFLTKWLNRLQLMLNFKSE